jgi:hypothetical protein
MFFTTYLALSILSISQTFYGGGHYSAVTIHIPKQVSGHTREPDGTTQRIPSLSSTKSRKVRRKYFLFK